jgi:hypothetical protein
MADEIVEDVPPPDPEVEGVRLSRYAAVVAYLSEGIDFDAALAHAGVAAAAWGPVSAAWGTALAKSAANDGVLLDAFEAHRAAAHEHVERKLPPLDTDYPAYVRFTQAFLQSANQLDFLAERHLTQNDFFRLMALWQRRLESDPSLRETAADAWTGADGPLPEVHPEPPRLRR